MRRVLLLGAAALAVRPLLRNAGATGAERRRALPGDELIPRPRSPSTMATTIEAPPEAVWPWLVQMGIGRGGWYSWDRLDNRGEPSADEIHPEWQELAVGERLAASPDDRLGFTVERLDPPRSLVLRAEPGGATWAFALERDGDRTRLLVRTRDAARPWTPTAVAAALFWDPMHVVMQRRQLRNLRRLAARHYNASEEPEPDDAIPAQSRHEPVTS